MIDPSTPEITALGHIVEELTLDWLALAVDFPTSSSQLC